jgi:hypothetical protein
MESAVLVDSLSGMRRSLGPVLIALALSVGEVRADALGWLNSRVDRLLADDKKQDQELNAPFDRYLKMLSSPGDTGPPASTEAPQASPQPKLSDALREIIPDGGDRDTTFFYQNVYLLGVLSAQLGFRTPFRVVGHLGEGIEPGVQLLERVLSEFRKDPGKVTVMKLHQLVERAMVQVQSTHQLMVESRDVLEAARNQLSRTGDLTDRLIAEEGRLQSIPAVLGIGQTGRKGVDNLSAALNTLQGCVTHFRTAWHALKRELQDLDEVIATSAWTSDRITLDGRRDRAKVLEEQLGIALAAMKEAGVVVRTDLALIRLNHQGLMQVLTTLSASPLSRQRRDDIGLPGGNESLLDRERVAGLAFAKVNPRLAETVGQLAALGRDMEVRRTRLEEWAKGLRAYKPQPVTVDDLPDWVFSESTVPGREKKWQGLSLLPERESEVAGLIETLEQDLKIGPSKKESARMAREQARLDETLGDAGSPADSPLDRAERPVVPTIDDGPGVPKAPTSPPSPSGEPAYDLPGWF